MMRWGTLGAVITLCLLCRETQGCGSIEYNRIDFICRGTGERALQMPQADFLSELSIHFGLPDRVEENGYPRTERIQHSQRANLADLAEALTAYRLDDGSVNLIIDSYAAFLEDMRRPELVKREEVRHGSRYGFKNVASKRYISTRLETYPSLIGILPREFELYLRGAADYHTQHFRDAIKYWSELLDLPEDLRPYRSTWAAFMIGKARQKLGQADAVDYYEQCRELVAAGFKDSLNLGTSSYGWQAQSEMKNKNYVDALRHYLILFQQGDGHEKNDAYLSLRMLCSRAAQDSEALGTVVSDPIASQIMSLWLISDGASPHYVEGWLAALDAADVDSQPLAAGRIAWLAYSNGNMDQAQRLVNNAAADDFAAQWVQSKLFMRAGKIEEAEKVLRDLEDRQQPPFALEEEYPSYQRYDEAKSSRVRGDLGALLFNQGRFDDAFDAFVLGQYESDAWFVGFQLFSLSEHQAAVDRVSTLGSVPVQTLKNLRERLGTRLISAEAYQTAASYFPSDTMVEFPMEGGGVSSQSLSSVVELFTAAMVSSRMKTTDRTERGVHRLRAADISYYFGDRFFLSHHAYDGVWKNAVDDLPIRQEGLVQEISNRIAANTPEKPIHGVYWLHRYKTADLYWEAAMLLPDNDPRTARALWQAGRYLAPKDPEAADRFYKALVRRCGKLSIGQEADKKRWFPTEFNGATETSS